MTHPRSPHDPSKVDQGAGDLDSAAVPSPLQGTDREIEQFIEMTFAAADVPHEAGIERLDPTMSLKEKVWPPPEHPILGDAQRKAPAQNRALPREPIRDVAAAVPKQATQEIDLNDIVVESAPPVTHNSAITPLPQHGLMLDNSDDATRADNDAVFSDEPLPLPALKVQQPKRQLTLIGVDVREFLAAARQDGSRTIAITLVALVILTVGTLGAGFVLRGRIVNALTPVLPPPTAADEALSQALQAKQEYVTGVAAVQKGQLKSAQEIFARVLTMDPTLVVAHRSLGIVYGKLGDVARAADHYRTYVAAAPDAPDAARVKQVVQAYDDAQARAHAEALAAAAAEEARVKAEAAQRALAEQKAQAAALKATALKAGMRANKNAKAAGSGSGSDARGTRRRTQLHPKPKKQ